MESEPLSDLPEWQKAELDRRHAEFERNPQSGVSWEEVLRQVQQRRFDDRDE